MENGKWKMENGRRKAHIKEENLIDAAYELFCKNLKKIREVADIKTICMHGSPLSPFDNKAIWKKYNYKDLGIIGEPYLDIDWNEWFYFTDTGRSWNAGNSSIRDKVRSNQPMMDKFKNTQDIIENMNKLPDKIMFTIHPQRWTDKPLPWLKEYIGQSFKNVVKRLIVIRREQRLEMPNGK